MRLYLIYTSLIIASKKNETDHSGCVKKKMKIKDYFTEEYAKPYQSIISIFNTGNQNSEIETKGNDSSDILEKILPHKIKSSNTATSKNLTNLKNLHKAFINLIEFSIINSSKIGLILKTLFTKEDGTLNSIEFSSTESAFTPRQMTNLVTFEIFEDLFNRNKVFEEILNSSIFTNLNLRKKPENGLSTILNVKPENLSFSILNSEYSGLNFDQKIGIILNHLFLKLEKDQEIAFKLFILVNDLTIGICRSCPLVCKSVLEKFVLDTAFIDEFLVLQELKLSEYINHLIIRLLYKIYNSAIFKILDSAENVTFNENLDKWNQIIHWTILLYSVSKTHLQNENILWDSYLLLCFDLKIIKHLKMNEKCADDAELIQDLILKSLNSLKIAKFQNPKEIGEIICKFLMNLFEKDLVIYEAIEEIDKNSFQLNKFC